jgi:hypothetical protein
MPRRKPIDQERIRALALALPEAQEGVHLGRPDFRVKGKNFVTLPEDGTTVHLKTSAARLAALIKADPDTFKDVWGGRWVGVDLARVKPNQLLDLIIEAWRQAAPKRLASKPLAKKLN